MGVDFTRLYQEYAQKVYQFLLSLSGDAGLAEELTEETFYQAFLHIDRFRGECEISTWLCQIGKNAYFKEAKRRGRQVPPELVEEPVGPDPSAGFLDREQAMELHRLLHELPEPYREVFSLRVFGELKFSEIASLFHRSESWAKMTFYRAKAKLIQGMEESK